MNDIQILLVAGSLLVLILNAITSIASRRFNFNYANLAPLSFVIYTATGFFGAKLSDQSSGVIVAASMGFVEATIGWKISMILKANTGALNNTPTTSRWILTVIIVTFLAATWGFAGTVIFKSTR